MADASDSDPDSEPGPDTARDLDPGLIWVSLEQGGGNWGTAVLASTGAEGPDARTVVLRRATASTRRLIFYSATDAAKVAQLEQEPRCCAVVYDRERGLQVRLYGEATRINDDNWLDQAWQSLPAIKREVFCLRRSGEGRGNFSAFTVQVDRMHVLKLHADGRNEALLYHWESQAGKEGLWRSAPVPP